MPVRTWRLRGFHAKIRGPCQDKSDRVAFPCVLQLSESVADTARIIGLSSALKMARITSDRDRWTILSIKNGPNHLGLLPIANLSLACSGFLKVRCASPGRHPVCRQSPESQGGRCVCGPESPRIVTVGPCSAFFWPESPRIVTVRPSSALMARITSDRDH